MDEPAMIRRICAGEKVLFHQLISPYSRLLFSAAYSVLRNPQDAEEAVQEAALNAFLHLPSLEDSSRFKAWITQITINEARKTRRRLRGSSFESLSEDHPRGTESDRPRQFADWHDLPDEAVEREEFCIAVRRAVATLPEIYRSVYLLSDAEKMSQAEIADSLGIAVGLVKTRLHRARMRVQEQLAPRFRSHLSDHVRLMKGMNPWSRAAR